MSQSQPESPTPAASALSRREQRLHDCRNSVWGEIVELGQALTTKPDTLERAVRDGSFDRVVFSCKMYLYDPTMVQAGLVTVQQSIKVSSLSSTSGSLTERYRRLGWVDVLHDALVAFPQESDEFIALAMWNLEHVANLETILPKAASASSSNPQHHQHHANKRGTRCFNRDTRWLVIPKKKKKLLPTVLDILSQTVPPEVQGSATRNEAAKIRLLLHQRAKPILNLIIKLFQQEDAEATQQPESESSSRKLAPLLLANNIISLLHRLLLFLLNENQQQPEDETSSSSTVLVHQATRVLYHLLQACCSTQHGARKREEENGTSLAWMCRSAMAHELMDPLLRVLQQYSAKEVVHPAGSPETNNSNGKNSHPSLAPEIVQTLVDCLWYLTTETATQSRKLKHDSFASTSRLNGNGNGGNCPGDNHLDTEQNEEEEPEDEEEELVLEEPVRTALVDCLTQNIVPSRRQSSPGKKPTAASSTLSLCSSDDDDEFIYGIRGHGGDGGGLKGGEVLNPHHPGIWDPHVIATALIVLDNLKKMAATTSHTSPTMTTTTSNRTGGNKTAPAARRELPGADSLSPTAGALSSFFLREEDVVEGTTNTRLERRRAALQQRMSSASMSSISSASTESTTTTRSSSAGSFATGGVRTATAVTAAAEAQAAAAARTGTGTGIHHHRPSSMPAKDGDEEEDEDEEEEEEEEESKSLSSSSHSSSSSSDSSNSSSSASSSSASSSSNKVDAAPSAAAKLPELTAVTAVALKKVETTKPASGNVGRPLLSKHLAAEQRQAAAVCVLNGSRWEKLSSEKQSTCLDGANADTSKKDDDSCSSGQSSSSNSISLASFQAASLHSSYHSSTSNASASTSTSSLLTPDPAPAVWKNNQGTRALPSDSNRSRSSSRRRRRRRRRRRHQKDEAKLAEEEKHQEARDSRWDSSPPPPSSSAIASSNHQPKPPSRDIKTSARMVRGSRWDSSPPREKDTTPPRQPQDKATAFALRKSRWEPGSTH